MTFLPVDCCCYVALCCDYEIVVYFVWVFFASKMTEMNREDIYKLLKWNKNNNEIQL